jgi:hypothetical protein
VNIGVDDRRSVRVFFARDEVRAACPSHAARLLAATKLDRDDRRSAATKLDRDDRRSAATKLDRDDRRSAAISCAGR